MQFVVHAIDKADILATRAKFYRQHRIHLDEAGKHGIAVLTAGTLVADDGETPIGSLFVVDAEDRTTLDAFTCSDPCYVNGVWESSKSTLIGRSAVYDDLDLYGSRADDPVAVHHNSEAASRGGLPDLK